MAKAPEQDQAEAILGSWRPPLAPLVARRKADLEKRWRPVAAHGPGPRSAAAGRPRGLAALANNFADMQGNPENATAIFAAPSQDRENRNQRCCHGCPWGFL